MGYLVLCDYVYYVYSCITSTDSVTTICTVISVKRVAGDVNGTKIR